MSAFPATEDDLNLVPDFRDPTVADLHQGFRVTDLASADWAMRKLAVKRAWMAEQSAYYDSELDRLGAWLDEAKASAADTEGFFGSLLEDWHRRVLDTDEKQKTIKLPSGELKARKLPDGVVIADPDAFVCAHGFASDLVRVKATPDLNAVKKAVLRDGESLVGVEVVPGEVRFAAVTAPPILPPAAPVGF